MIVITSGEKYVDIDALACAVAYRELMNKMGEDVIVVFPGELNHSISQFIRDSYKFEISTKPPKSVSGYVLVDISDPAYISSFVQPKDVLKVFDHHYGFKEYWSNTIGKDNTKIEMIGACATLIWEEFKKHGFADTISTESASLLAIAIISNTLDLKVSLTSERDIDAYTELEQKSNLLPSWKETYFNEQQTEIFGNTQNAITNDTKIQNIPSLDKPLAIAQIELWNGKIFFEKYKEEIIDNLNKHNTPHWMFTIASISEGKNYLYTESEVVQKLLKVKLGFNFKENTCVTESLILRKEILKSLLVSS